MDPECYYIFNDGKIFPCSKVDTLFMNNYRKEHDSTPLGKIYLIADEFNPLNPIHNGHTVVKEKDLQTYISVLLMSHTQEIAGTVLPNW